MLSYKQELTAAGLNERLASKTHDTTIAGRYTFSNTENCIDFNSGALQVKGGGYVDKDFRVGQVLSVADLEILKNIKINSFSDLTTTGTNAELSATDKSAIILLDSDLESISTIIGKANDKFLILVNSTGNDIELNHSDDSLVDTKIISSSGAPIKVKDSSFVLLFYCGPLSGWLVVNGGGGTGSGVMVVSDLTARNNIPEGTRTNGMLVQVISEDTIYKLIGLPVGATTTDANWDPVITGKASQVITNKDIDGGTASNTSRQTLPKDQMSRLLNLNRKEGTLTYDTQSKQPLYDDGTSLVPMGPEVVNFIKNGKADFNDLGWNRYVNAAGAVPVNGTGGDSLDSSMGLVITTDSFVLSGHKCFELNKYAGNAQGKGFSYDFTIDRASLASMLTVTFDYEVSFGTFNAGSDTTNSDLMIYLYDITNNKIIYPQGGSKLYSQKDQYRAWFQSAPDSYNYRLILHCATTNAAVWAMTLDNFSVSRTNYAFGSIKTNYKQFSGSITGFTGTLNVGTGGAAEQTMEWAQDGQDLLINYRVKVGTSGAVDIGSGVYSFPLPPGITTSLSNFTVVGYGDISVAASGLPAARLIAKVYLGKIIFDRTDSNTLDAGGILFNSANIMSASIRLKIEGWSSGAQISDGYDGRVVSTLALTNASSNLAPNGTAIKININSLSSFTPNNNALFDAANSRIVIKSAGTYLVTASVGLTGVNVLNSRYQSFFRLTRNAVGTDFGAMESVPQAGKLIVISGSRLVDLIAGDILELYLFGEGNNSVNQIANVAGTSTSLSLFKLSGSAFMSPTASVAESWGGTAGDTIGTSLSLIKFITKEDSTHGSYNPATGLFTAPTSGKYSVAWRVAAASLNISTSQRFTTVLHKNGSQYKNGERLNGNGASTSYSSGGSISEVNLNQGETMSIYAVSDVATSSATASEASYFSIIKVG